MAESPYKLLIKNMVCRRCMMTVEEICNQLRLPLVSIAIGEVHLQRKLTGEEEEKLEQELSRVGLQLMEKRLNKTVGEIKKLVSDYLGLGMDSQNEKLSAFIENRMSNDYSHLSDLFSAAEGKTIEQYFIQLRIEKVKELMVYEGLSLTEISYQTGFSSVHHLSAQFKKVTGLTPSHFKSISSDKRMSLPNA